MKDEREKECHSFHEAKEFYEVQPVSPRISDEEDESTPPGLDFLSGAIIAESIMSSDPEPISMPDPDPSSSFDSGGGDFGGGGSGSDY